MDDVTTISFEQWATANGIDLHLENSQEIAFLRATWDKAFEQGEIACRVRRQHERFNPDLADIEHAKIAADRFTA